MSKRKSIKQQIKEMEAKKREEVQANLPPPKPSPAKQEKTISFDQWWMKVTKRVKLSTWLKEVILADFKARGLSKEETEERFNKALELFGYKLP